MLNNKSEPKKEQTHRLKQSQIKTSLVDLMMRTRISIPEPEIRVYLHKKYGVKDQGTINIHLHSLEKLGCIDLITTNKEVTRANQWGIETLDNLKNIRQHFPDIPFNKYEKSLQIVSENRLLHRNYPRHNVFAYI